MRFLIPLLLLLNFTYAKTNIVVSILPQKTFVEKIGGDKVNVTNMVKPGNDPHTYEPKPSQMREISKANIYFPIGLEFENTWLAKFSTQNKNMKFVEMTKDVEYIEMAKHSHQHKHEEEEHQESELPYEWAGVFDLKKGIYTWSFSKVEGNYADPKMKMLIIKANKNEKNLIEAYENQAKNTFSNNKAETVTNNTSLETNNSFYSLSFDSSKNKTIFKVQIKQSGKYIFFTEHMPVEFEAEEHYFKDSAKKDIEVLTSIPKEDHHGKDPHVWVSPKNVKIMAKNIYNTLVATDSKNQNYYKTNYDNFINEINQTDEKIKKILSVLPKNSKFMVFHPSWGYFAKDYNIEQLVIEVEGKEPKPKILQKIIKEAKEEKVKAIFTQTEFSDKSAKVIADELKIKVIKETPLAQNWSQNLIQMANSIANNN